MSRIPRRASRNLWHRLKRWVRSLRNHYTVITFDEAPAKGVKITFDYSGSFEEQERGKTNGR